MVTDDPGLRHVDVGACLLNSDSEEYTQHGAEAAAQALVRDKFLRKECDRGMVLRWSEHSFSERRR